MYVEQDSLPFPLLGFDTDNDSVFMNEAVRDCCAAARIAFTRCRPYRKNDQAWVEQKNGAVVRPHRRLPAHRGLGSSGDVGPALWVGPPVRELLPAVVQAGREDARRGEGDEALLRPGHALSAANDRPAHEHEVRRRAGALHAALDPVRLLSELRLAQQLVEIADRPATGEAAAPSAPTRAQFLLGLQTSWQEGEVRPTAKPKKRVAPYCRYVPDPFEAVAAQVRGWFEAEPWRTARELLERLRGEHPGVHSDGQLRTLQRRLKVWRREVAIYQKSNQAFLLFCLDVFWPFPAVLHHVDFVDMIPGFLQGLHDQERFRHSTLHGFECQLVIQIVRDVSPDADDAGRVRGGRNYGRLWSLWCGSGCRHTGRGAPFLSD